MTEHAAATKPETGVPFVDLGRMHDPVRESILADISELIDSGAFVNGPQVASLESAFAAYCETSFCVGLASGLDALRLAFLAAGIEAGDEVIVPANTFVATFEAVSQAGGVPVPVDVRQSDFNMDPDAAAAAVTERTRFLLPVHLYGQMADMRALREVAGRGDLQILEDACQAHGAERDGLRAGAAGMAGAFSFYPAKNLGAMGDAGALVTNDDRLAQSVRSLREHGQSRKYHHDREGYTARLDTLQAIVLLHKLRRLDSWNAERRAVAAFYDEALAGVGDLRLPRVASGSSPVWHLYVVRTADPAALAGHLRTRGIGTGRHYPEPPHLSRAYAAYAFSREAFPVTEAIAQEVLSLPIFPGMTDDELDAVTGTIRAYFGQALA